MNHNQKYLLSGKCLQTLFVKKYLYEKRRTALYRPPDFGIPKKIGTVPGTYSQITTKCSHWKLFNDTVVPWLG